jgi:histidine phosphotransferase ChpT
VGAIANGVELLSQGTGAPDTEVVGLIGDSARVASARLQFFRAALGTASALSQSNPFDEARRLAAALFAGSRATLDWPQGGSALESAVGRIAVRIALNLVAIAQDALPRGGTVRVAANLADGWLSYVVSARGAETRIAADVHAALEGRLALSELGPRTIVAYLAERLTQAGGGRLRVASPSPEAVDFVSRLPAGV